MHSKQALSIALTLIACHLALVGQEGRGLGEEHPCMRSTQHPPFHSGYFYLGACPVATTSAREKNSLQCQTNLAFSRALALLGFADIITIQVSRGLEQFFAKMRIAVNLAINSDKLGGRSPEKSSKLPIQDDRSVAPPSDRPRLNLLRFIMNLQSSFIPFPINNATVKSNACALARGNHGGGLPLITPKLT